MIKIKKLASIDNVPYFVVVFQYVDCLITYSLELFNLYFPVKTFRIANLIR